MQLLPSLFTFFHKVRVEWWLVLTLFLMYLGKITDALEYGCLVILDDLETITMPNIINCWSCNLRCSLIIGSNNWKLFFSNLELFCNWYSTKYALLCTFKFFHFFFSLLVFVFHYNNIFNAFWATCARLIIKKLFLCRLLRTRLISSINRCLNITLLALFIRHLHPFVKTYFLPTTICTGCIIVNVASRFYGLLCFRSFTFQEIHIRLHRGMRSLEFSFYIWFFFLIVRINLARGCTRQVISGDRALFESLLASEVSNDVLRLDLADDLDFPTITKLWLLDRFRDDLSCTMLKRFFFNWNGRLRPVKEFRIFWNLHFFMVSSRLRTHYFFLDLL
jgi:hypothetical protein